MTSFLWNPATPQTLADLPVGKRAVVSALTATLTGGTLSSATATQLRLVELGFVPGAEVRVVHQGLLGDPIAVEVMDTVVCVRRADALGFAVDTTMDGAR